MADKFSFKPLETLGLVCAALGIFKVDLNQLVLETEVVKGSVGVTRTWWLEMRLG